MPRGDDDDDDAIATSVVRYPCMPSLVALQQMRNRLHLAYVGKKLMKWTAMATGRELRKLAFELSMTYTSFREDIADAYILLARSRFFCPTMNQMVLENIGYEAAVKVGVTPKSISGVKVLHMQILDSNLDPYTHLGIERGGQSITEAKQIWRDMLKRVIMMLEYRYCFKEVDVAHKSATKRQNTLAKLVIPRCKLTIVYILAQMEEFSRENFYRMKMILALKRKRGVKEPKRDITCPICLRTRSKREEPIVRCYGCGAYVNLEGISTTIEDGRVDNEDKLQEFRIRLDQIVDITKQIEGKTEMQNLQEFLKSIEGLKKKLDEPKPDQYLHYIPPHIPMDRLCGLCTQRAYLEREEKADLKAAKDAARTDANIMEPKGSKTTIKSVIKTEPLCQKHATIADLELGVFEIETQEITKIVRVRNEDGSVSEQRKVIRLKKESHTPLVKKEDKQPSHESLKKLKKPSEDSLSCTFSVCSKSCSREKLQHCSTGSKSSLKKDSKTTVGLVTVEEIKKNNLWRSQSEAVVTSQQMCVLDVRTCQSLTNFSTYLALTDNLMPSDESSSHSEKACDKSCERTEFEESLELHEFNTKQNNRVIILSPVTINCNNNSLSHSENNLLGKSTDYKPKIKSKSENVIKIKLKQCMKLLKRSFSLNIKGNKASDLFNNELCEKNIVNQAIELGE